MRLSTKGRYAVMALVELAGAESGRPTALAEIAERQQISLSYLEQLFAKLRRGGLVNAVRGPGGGYLMGHDPQEIRISDIVAAVDEPVPTTRCTPVQPAGCRDNPVRCATHDLWEELDNKIFLYLESVTLADVIGRETGPTGPAADGGEPTAPPS
ncbi:MAG: Rrf2 family transcriptional regulator [Kiloniellales bacterium]|nr:Rrf2 family transcriptional regulator [Kiloniellales bacterium]